MSKENYYISYGGGVNSTTFLVLEETKMDEAVFVDHGADYPYTYEYVKYIQSKGFDVTTIKPCVGDREKNTWNNLYTYCYDKRIVPSRQFRWCTDKFKIQPVLKYVERPCTIFIGFDAGEIRRITKMKIHGVTYDYPLIRKHITREGCKKLIADAGLTVPGKSGCYICPFCTAGEFRHMSVEYPDLFERACALEENCMRPDLGLCDTPLRTLAGWDSHKLTEWCHTEEVTV